MQAAGAFNYTMKMAVGVAGLISPWNLPLYLLTFKLAPALIAGNTVVAKPSEMTSVTAWKLAELLNEAGNVLRWTFQNDSPTLETFFFSFFLSFFFFSLINNRTFCNAPLHKKRKIMNLSNLKFKFYKSYGH